MENCHFRFPIPEVFAVKMNGPIFITRQKTKKKSWSQWPVLPNFVQHQADISLKKNRRSRNFGGLDATNKLLIIFRQNFGISSIVKNHTQKIDHYAACK